MATDIATLGLKLDGDGLVTGTDKAAVAVKRLGQEGDKTEQQVGKLDLTLKRAAGSTQAFEAAQKRATAVARQQAASDRGIMSLLEARRQRDIVESAASGAATAKAFTDAQEREFRFQMAALKEESARGLITPAEAARRGRDAATAYNQAILSRISTVGGAGGFEGGGRERFAALAGSLKNVDVAGRSAAGGVGRLNLTLASLLSQATQTHPAVGQLTQVVGSLAIGSGLMLGVLGGLAALGLAYRNLTQDARDSKDAHDESIKNLKELQRLQEIAALGPGGETVRDIERARADVTRLFAEIAEQEAMRGGIVGGIRIDINVDPNIARLRERLEESFALIRTGEQKITEATEEDEEERTAIAQREADERARIAEQEARLVAASQRVADNLIIQIDAQERLLAAQKEGEEAVRLVTAALAREQALRVALVNSTTEQAAEITRLVGEYHDLIDALADEKRAVEQGEAAYKRFLEIIAQGNKDREAAERARLKANGDEIRAEKERTRTIREQIGQGEEYATSVIQVANAFGFLDDEAARALESVVQIGAAVARIAILNDPTAIPSLIGGIASLFGGGGGPSEAELRAERLQTENNRILERNNRSLERLRDQLPSAGLTGAEAQATIDAINTARAIRQPPRDEGGFTPGGGFTPFGGGFGDRGFTPTGGGTAPISFVDALETAGLSMEELGRIARQLGVEIFDAAGNLDLIALEEAAEIWIKVQKQIEAALVQDLGVRRLRALGMDKEAEALRLQIQHERELAEARAAGFRTETIAALKSVQALEKLAAARQDELAAIQALRDFQNSLRLGPLSTLSPSAQLDEARRQFEETRSAASVGDAEAAADLPAVARAFLEASRAFNASGPQFAADFKLVNDTITSLTDMFGEQQSINAKIAEETKINGSTLRESLTEHKATVRVLSAGLTQVVEELQSLREEQRDQVRHRREVIEEAA